MEHCLLSPSIDAVHEVCASCRRGVATCVRADLPRSPVRLAQVVGDELEELTDYVIEKTLAKAKTGAIEAETLAAWVYRCSKNRVLDRIRYWRADRRAIEREIDGTRGRDALAGVADPTRPGPGVHTRIDMADELVLLKRLLRAEDSPEARAVQLRYLEASDASWAELAVEVGLGEGAGDRLRMRVQSLFTRLAREVSRARSGRG